MDALGFLAPRSGVTPSSLRQPRRLGAGIDLLVRRLRHGKVSSQTLQAAAALMAPASTRDTIRKRVVLLLEAGVPNLELSGYS